MKVKYLIIGAGPTGLGAAYRLKEKGILDFLIVDADSEVGGLAKSYQDDQGFTWDIGGHVQFSHYPYFDKLMDLAIKPEYWLNHHRESWVWIRERFVPYPFQNNLRYLPTEELWTCLSGALEIQNQISNVAPKNFKEWIHATFGPGIAKVFMEPYNFKVWATPLEQMSFQWIGERVSVVDFPRILSNVIHGKDDVSWGPNNKFRFPMHGGTGAIWKSVANLIGMNKIRLSTPITAIDGTKKVASLKSGEQIEFDTCLSTMPINCLVKMVKEYPIALQNRAQQLRYSSSNIIGIGLSGQPSESLKGKCWMYFPEMNCPFYRVTLFSHYSPQNVPSPQDQYSLMLEVSESQDKPVNPQTVVQECIEGLKATRLMGKENKVLTEWYYRAPYGYPTPTTQRDAILDALHPELEKQKIYSRGRFGGWKYEVSNQDHSLMQGVEWVNWILEGSEETTYRWNRLPASGGKKRAA